MSQWWARLRLRTKLYCAFSSLVLVVLLLALYLSHRNATNQIRMMLRDDLEDSVRVFHRFTGVRMRALLDQTSAFARDYALRQAVATAADPLTLRSVAENFRDRVGAELAWITGADGELLADAAGAKVPGTSMIEIDPITSAVAGEAPASGINEIDGALFQLVAVPLLAPDVIGYVVAGKAMDDLASSLRDDTRSHVTFLSDQRVFASSWPAAQRLKLFGHPAVSGGSMMSRMDQDFFMEMDDERFQSLVVQINTNLERPLFAVVQRSYDAELKPLTELRRRFLVVGVVALVLGLGVGAVLSRSITRGFQQLVNAMGAVLQGDLKQRVQIDRQDEVGFLARSFNEMVSGLEDREKIKDAFGRFVSRDVAKAYLAGEIPLQGERREVSILFLDLRNFTPLSASMTPEQLVRILNRFFTQMVAAVEEHGGVVKQFTGDGLMALFGAPMNHADHADRAAGAAVRMTERLATLNDQFEREGLPRLQIGVGVHTGEVVAGPIGPDERLEYAVVGDPANVASRIEGQTKIFQTAILISEATAARLTRPFRCGRREPVSLKGKDQPIVLVEVLGA